MMGELQFIKNMKGSGCDLKEDAGLLFGSGLKKKKQQQDSIVGLEPEF